MAFGILITFFIIAQDDNITSEQLSCIINEIINPELIEPMSSNNRELTDPFAYRKL